MVHNLKLIHEEQQLKQVEHVIQLVVMVKLQLVYQRTLVKQQHASS